MAGNWWKRRGGCRPDLKVIIASGYSTEHAAGDRPDGDVTHLTKPFDLGQLRRALGA